MYILNFKICKLNMKDAVWPTYQAEQPPITVQCLSEVEFHGLTTIATSTYSHTNHLREVFQLQEGLSFESFVCNSK